LQTVAIPSATERGAKATSDEDKRAHGGALLARLLAAYGVRHVFGVPGGQTLALYDGILDLEPRLRHILVRDERTAAYAADGYARVTGRVGVCDATAGPGAAKLPSGLGEALGASVPVLALVSDLLASLAPHRYRSAVSQALDQAGLLAPVTKWQAAVPDLAAMPSLVGRAFREATTGRPGPVALLLPQDVLDAVAGPGQSAAAAGAPGGERFGFFPAFQPHPEPGDVTAAAAALRRAFCVRAALLGDARAGLEALASALGPEPDAAGPDRAPWRARLADLMAGWRASRDSERSSDAVPIAERGLPVVIVVLNNRSLAWIRWYRRITFGRGWESDDFADVAFADVARAFGLRGRRVTQPRQLGPALRAALTAGRPSLIDIVTDAWQTPIAAHRRAVGQSAGG